MTAPATVRPVLGRLRERMTTLAGLAVTPLVPADYVDLIDPLRSSNDLRGRIVEVRPETRDAVTVVIRPGRGWQPHLPGQYVRIGVDVDGVRQWRTYSLTSEVPRPDRCIAITVKAIPGGTVSGYLVRKAQPGLVVQLDQAMGEFVLPATRPAKVLFVTAGSGITPVMGMLRNAVDELEDVVVVHTAPVPAEVVFGGELRALAAEGRIRLVERHSRLEGRLDVDSLTAAVPDLADRETWACGPTELLDSLEAHWAGLGLADRLHVERFRPARARHGRRRHRDLQPQRDHRRVRRRHAAAGVRRGAGVLMPSGCRMGICFGCVVPLRSGAVRDLRDGAVTTAAEGDGVLVQTCVSAAAGECDIEL
jgi:ferredoxin-NADP reductase